MIEKTKKICCYYKLNQLSTSYKKLFIERIVSLSRNDCFKYIEMRIHNTNAEYFLVRTICVLGH